MANRHETNDAIDAKIFRVTAANSKVVNIVPMDMRGGFRL